MFIFTGSPPPFVYCIGYFFLSTIITLVTAYAPRTKNSTGSATLSPAANQATSSSASPTQATSLLSARRWWSWSVSAFTSPATTGFASTKGATATASPGYQSSSVIRVGQASTSCITYFATTITTIPLLDHRTPQRRHFAHVV
mmetsp:Transcript_38378/g.105883  ORF Transcript_38378/g.105883 Transcript_38378/m.105883 type:complete len:143 (+) Transcript_38378:238-666(+)